MNPIIITNKGQRDINQDYVLAQNINPDTLLLIVSDGMGGYDYGDIAAKLVAENVLAYLSTITDINPDQLQKAINKSNLAVKQLKHEKKTDAGATVGGIVINQNKAICFWVGDVKVFHFRDGKLQFESPSHTLINEVKKNGSINNTDKLERYRHVVTRSVQGDIKKSEVETRILNDVYTKDIFVVCSDGVHDIIDGLSYQYYLKSSADLVQAINKIKERLRQEAKDNFSMIVFKY